MIALQKKLDAPTLLLLGGILFWIALYAFIGPQPAGVDAFYFKDAGINFATGKGFKDILSPGNPTLEYKYYATYPPVYPFLYGLYVFVFGVGDYQNTYFNLLLQIIRAVLLFIIIVKYGTDWTPNQKMIITGVLILSLPFSTAHDRPEDLVMILFLMSLLFYLRRQHKIAFLVAGLNLMTSPVFGVINVLFLVGIYFYNIFKEKVEWKQLLEKLYPMLYVLIFPAVIITILALLDVSIFKRFYNYLIYMAKEHALPTHLEYAKRLLNGFYGFHNSSSFYLFILVMLLGFWTALRLYQVSEKGLALLIAALVGIICILNFLVRTYYYTFGFALFVAISLYVFTIDVDKIRQFRKRVLLTSLVIMLLVIFPKIVREIYLRTFPMNNKEHKEATVLVRDFFKDKRGSLVVIQEFAPRYYFMLKGVNSILTAAHYAYVSEKSEFPEYIVESPTNKDSIMIFIPEIEIRKLEMNEFQLYRKVFETEKSVPNPQNTFWERLLMRPYDTWYPVIYERIDE